MSKLLRLNKKNFRSLLDKITHNRNQIDIKTEFIVNKIIKDVIKNGDRALIKYEKKFNNNSNIIPTNDKIKRSISNLKPELKKAIKDTYNRITSWHKLQNKRDIYQKDKFGNRFQYINRPLKSAAIYCPGNLPSTALMNCALAKIAGVKRVVLCTPAINGKLNGSVMYAAKLCNVNEIINLSGASAIAALSIGTKKIKPVDIITGPGSKYVAIAKRILSYKNFIAQERMYAGESEIVCWCDDTASPDEIAYSLLAQSEHSDGVLSIMISKDFKLIKKVQNKLKLLINNLPRKKIISKSLKKNGYLIHAKTDNEILDCIEYICPEHLELQIKNYKKYINKLHPKLNTTGSIAAGPYSSMALSDYGPTQHSLPTGGSARYSGGLNVSDFCKYISLNELSKKGLKFLSKSGYILAQEEKLRGHSLSIKTKALRRK